jgi:hypothetical protein
MSRDANSNANDSAPDPCGVSSVLDRRPFGEGAGAIRPVLSRLRAGCEDEISCYGGSGRLYRFGHSGTARAASTRCAATPREKVGEQNVRVRLQRHNGSTNNDIMNMARARFVKLSGTITDHNDFACVA